MYRALIFKRFTITDFDFSIYAILFSIYRWVKLKGEMYVVGCNWTLAIEKYLFMTLTLFSLSYSCWNQWFLFWVCVPFKGLVWTYRRRIGISPSALENLSICVVLYRSFFYTGKLAVKNTKNAFFFSCNFWCRSHF